MSSEGGELQVSLQPAFRFCGCKAVGIEVQAEATRWRSYEASWLLDPNYNGTESCDRTHRASLVSQDQLALHSRVSQVGLSPKHKASGYCLLTGLQRSLSDRA